jgi:lipoate-protein ligase B
VSEESSAVGADRYPEGVLDVRQIGFSAYAAAYALQRELVAKRLQDEVGDVLVLTEHEPVVTVGRGTPRDGWPTTDLPVVEIERGGEATYHGPGQLVAYPILRLPDGRRDLHAYLRDLEEVVIRCLAEVDVEGVRRAGLTGVWLGDKKVCSIGVTAKGWVTSHGFALNLRTDLDAFRAFRPCGLDPDVMTNLADHVDLPPGSLLFQVLVVKHVCGIFDLELPPPPPVHSPPEGGMPDLPIFPG